MSKKDELRALTKVDPFLESLQKLGAVVKSHQILVIASTAGLLLAGGALTFALAQKDKQSGAASKLLAEAQKTFDKMPLGDNATAAPPSAPAAAGEEKYSTKDEWRAAVMAKLAAIDSQFPGSGPARVAKLYRASLALDSKNPAEAETLYRAFIAESKNGDAMVGSAQISLAAALEDQGKVDEAAKLLAALIQPGKKAKDDKEAKLDPLGEEAIMALGRLQERAGKAADARATYERVKSEFPSSSARFKAEQRLSQLSKN